MVDNFPRNELRNSALRVTGCIDTSTVFFSQNSNHVFFFFFYFFPCGERLEIFGNESRLIIITDLIK